MKILYNGTFNHYAGTCYHYVDPPEDWQISAEEEQKITIIGVKENGTKA
ncbi:hypothetical protein NIES4102_44240 (plasmid) [Chondrocystis sp. NIES-4102]|nr:hypothetical protein NIES4102_44240 [Chondrocystis sp. NIES-4102]